MHSTAPLLALVCACVAISAVDSCTPGVRRFFIGPDPKIRKVEYKGCFKGEPHHTAREDTQIRTISCNKECNDKQYPYMGFQGTKCWCDTMLDNNDKDDDGMCTIECAGDHKEKCGGEKYFSGYSTSPDS